MDPNGNNPSTNNTDYSEQVDITSLHAAVTREKSEPTDGNEPISLWLVAFFGLTLFVGGIYLAMYSGGFQLYELSIYAGGGPGGGAGEDAGEVVPPTLAEIGEKVYRQNCLTCHGSNGLGQAGLYPPLVGVDWVTGSEKRLAGILLHGLGGPIEVNDVTYNGAMPAWGGESDERLAGVMTFIRSSWGNAASEITPGQVAAARDIFEGRTATWTQAELEAIPEGTPLPKPEGAAEPSPDEAGETVPVEAAPEGGAEEVAPAESEAAQAT